MFPQIAQTANIAGQVEASFVVDDDGNVISVAILSGPELLGIVTERNIRSWKFQDPGDASREPWRDHSTFVYKLVRGMPETLLVKMQSYRHIEIGAPVQILD
jgi:hypothetical protein